MAEDDELPAMDDELEESGNTGKRWLIIMGVLLLLAGGGAAAYFTMFAAGDDAAAEEAQMVEESPAKREKSSSKKSKDEVKPIFYDLPEFLVNLNTGGQKARFLKMQVSLELADEESLKVVQEFQPRIIDSLNTYLRELRASDLSGSAGLHRLREELLKRINQFIAPARAKNVLFTEIVVQ
jgi:flagellar FliL protein